MNRPLQDFLTARLPFPGLAAWSARLPDRTTARQCYTNWLTPSQVEQALSRLALAAEGLRYHQLEPSRLCWVFQHLRIHLAVRRDGACLALFVENRSDLAGGVPERILEEFAALE